MKQKWKVSNIFWDKYQCLYLGQGSTPEYGLFGKSGMIWEYNSSKYKAFISDTYVSNKYLGGKSFIIFDKKELSTWAKLLKIPKLGEWQLEYAS